MYRHNKIKHKGQVRRYSDHRHNWKQQRSTYFGGLKAQVGTIFKVKIVGRFGEDLNENSKRVIEICHRYDYKITPIYMVPTNLKA